MQQQPTTDPWTQVPTLLRLQTEHDLIDTGHGGFYVVAAAGPVPLFVATSRPFPKGQYAEPVIELAALALSLGGDRLGVGAVGRAWSPDDAVAPDEDGVDRRQRVLTIHTADAHQKLTPECGGYVIPFDLDDDGVTWQDQIDVGPGEGWIPVALQRLLTFRHHDDAPRVDPQAQLERCLALGHDVGVTPESATRFFPAEFATAERRDGSRT